MAAPTVCRVCLVSDRTMYRIANTKLEDTYEQVSKAKLQRVGWPVALCCICVSQLRRCLKFTEAVQEANEVLAQWWYKSRTEDLNLTERPLFSFTRTSPEITEVTSNGIEELKVKQEITIDKTENEDDINTSDKGAIFRTDYIKCEFVQIDDHENDNTCMSDEVNDKTQSDHSEFETVPCETLIDVQNDTIQLGNDVQTAPCTSNARWNESNCVSDDEYVPKIVRKSLKRPKLSKGTKGPPTFKKQRPIELQHRLVKTDGATAMAIEPYSCAECNYKTVIKRDFNLHLKKHTDEPFSCDKCDYKTSHKGHWKRHSFNHAGEKPLPCSECDYRGTTKSELKRHSLCHYKDQKPFQCSQCDFKCNRKENLKQHLMTHTGEKPFACDRCDFKSNRKTKLTMHLKSHTGEEPYSCNQCCYKTGSKSDLRRHLMRHAGEKPLACHLCDFKCLLKHELNRHLMTHSDTKPFTCSQCDYKSAQKRLLKLHLMKHTGVKPFACEKCDFKCNRKDKLRIHLMRHTDEKPFACNKCDYKSKVKGDLNKHYMTHSTDEKPLALAGSPSGVKLLVSFAQKSK